MTCGVRCLWIKTVFSGVPQGSVLGPLLFLIFINDLEDNTSGNVLKFADDTKIFRQVRDVQDNFSMQADLDQLVEWADKWQMQFNVSKCKVMHVGQKNPRSLYTMRNNGLQIVEVEKDLGVKISSDLCRVLSLSDCRYSLNPLSQTRID